MNNERKEYLLEYDDFDINEYLKNFYTIYGSEEVEKQIELDDLRSQNHEEYYKIDLLKLRDLPNEFDSIIDEIRKSYNVIQSDKLLIESESIAKEHQKLLSDINRNIKRLDMMVKTTLEELELENDERQSKLSIAYIKSLDIDFNLKSRILNLYNDLVLYNTELVKDNYEDLRRQVVRKQYLDYIFKLLNLEKSDNENKAFKKELIHLNKEIKDKIIEYDNKILYLEDLIDPTSKYKDEFSEFVNFYKKIKVYDDKNYENAKQTYEILSDKSMFADKIKSFENMFIDEFENTKKEESFVHNKIGIKNIRKSLDFISVNYMDILDSESKKIIEKAYDMLDSDYNIDALEEELLPVVSKIWKSSVTNINEYNSDEDFCFICSNNQFIDPKYECILITKKELESDFDYLDYQIGFICGYNDNILYITENDDIMSVEYDDMSKLKTPKQLEQEFVNFAVCNRLALNGYTTKIEAVYYIEDGDNIKYTKAQSLANDYNLPLIIIKK